MIKVPILNQLSLRLTETEGDDDDKSEMQIRLSLETKYYLGLFFLNMLSVMLYEFEFWKYGASKKGSKLFGHILFKTSVFTNIFLIGIQINNSLTYCIRYSIFLTTMVIEPNCKTFAILVSTTYFELFLILENIV